jgi:hypothetical protein
MYHDIIDVLYRTEPFQQEYLGHVTRDVYRPLAKQLHKQDPLHLMTIPRPEFDTLVRLLLSLHFDQPKAGFCSDMAELDSCASCIGEAFGQQGDLNVGITWEMFDYGLTEGTV